VLLQVGEVTGEKRRLVHRLVRVQTQIDTYGSIEALVHKHCTLQRLILTVPFAPWRLTAPAHQTYWSMSCVYIQSSTTGPGSEHWARWPEMNGYKCRDVAIAVSVLELRAHSQTPLR